MTNYQILEKDKKLFLAILEGEFCSYLIPGLEHISEPIEDLINGLDKGQFDNDDFLCWSPWSAAPRSPNKLYTGLILSGASIIADRWSINPQAMGETGIRVFRIRSAA